MASWCPSDSSFPRSDVRNLWQVHTTTHGAVRNPRRPSLSCTCGTEVTQTPGSGLNRRMWDLAPGSREDGVPVVLVSDGDAESRSCYPPLPHTPSRQLSFICACTSNTIIKCDTPFLPQICTSCCNKSPAVTRGVSRTDGDAAPMTDCH